MIQLIMITQSSARSFMDEALVLAAQAAACGEVPVGAIIVDAHERIIARAHNTIRTEHDPTAHAEMRVLQIAGAQLGNERLAECTLYVTLEPCAMCAAAIALARIKRLYYATSDPKSGVVEHGRCYFDQPYCHHRPEIYDGIGQVSAAALLRDFFAARRR